MSRVDVIVPCYNYARYLGPCVESVLRQEGVEVRVLIIDDASADETEAVGTRLADDPRVEYRRHATNQGHIRTFNEGLRWAEGDFTLILSADDMLTAGALGRAVRLMDSRPEVGLTYGEAVRTTAPDFSTISVPARYEVEVLTGAEFIEASCRVGGNLVETATAVVRTAVQKAVGGYREELPHTGDLEMWLRLAKVSSVGRVKVPQGFYRRHADNMSIRCAGRGDFDQLRAAFWFFFAGCGQLPDLDSLQMAAHKALAVQAFYLANEAFESGDRATCGALTAEALTLWPGVRAHPGWHRLRFKRILGRRLCAFFKSLWQPGHARREIIATS